VNQEEFNKMYLGIFTVDERTCALHDRLKKYYRDTPNSMSNADVIPYQKEFRAWIRDHGVTPQELNKAKRQGFDRE
jgi:N-acetylneuraminic acid mutarotase